MILQHLNWLAVGVSAISFFVLGALWFSKMLFANAWVKGHNLAVTEEDKKNMGKFMLMSLIYSVIAAIGIGWLDTVAMSTTMLTNHLMAGIKVGVICGGLAMIAIAMSHMYTKKSFSLALIDGGYHLVGMTIMSVIMTMWK